jgi:putative FmdB family regulatory protein
MPTYEYYCKACDHEWERDQRISEDPIKTCPKCKARKAKRMISQTSFVLKGSGWYSDLYSSSKDGGKKPDAGDAKPKSSGGDSEKKAEKSDKSKGKGKGKKSGSGGDKPSSGSKAAA